MLFGQILRAARGAAVFTVASLLLMAQAAAQSGFDNWVGSFRGEALAQGISAATYDRAMSGLEPDPEVIELAGKQPEFVRPVWDYLGSAVSDKRIETGRRMLQEHSGLLDIIEARYGVSRYVVVAIWGMESSYGEVLDNPKIVRSAIRSLATLAYAGGRRSKFGRQQLLAALQILERGDTTPERMTGSWAGAMGHTQFIPTTYNAYAVDFDNDGRRDIWTSIPDALGSTANYLDKSGWRSGETWGYEVELPSGFDYSLADQETRRPLSEWQRLGVRRVHGRDFPRPGDQAYLLLPAGAHGAAFLMLPNFKAILAYNNADAYALAVGHLADRLAGGEAFAGSWPTSDKPLTSGQRRELQTLLTRRGFDPGGVDGRVGPMTRSAIRSFQSRTGLPQDGYASYSLLERLRSGG